MINMRASRKEDQQKLRRFMDNQIFQAEVIDLASDEVCIMVLENDKVLGVATYDGICKDITSEKKDIGIMKYMVIDQGERRKSLGDGLLRATLNHMFLSGIKEAVISLNEESESFNGFLKWEELTPNEPFLLEAFFNRKCRGGQ